MGILDVLCPMAYTTDTNIFKTQIQIATTTAHAANKKVWAGIGAYRIPAESTIEKINAARTLNADGIILFSYDFTTTPSPLNPTADYLNQIRRTAFSAVRYSDCEDLPQPIPALKVSVSKLISSHSWAYAEGVG